MPSRIQPEWWIEERPDQWDASDVVRRSFAGCRRSGDDKKFTGLYDNGCSSSLINQCALNTYWLPEGYGKDLDIGEPASGSVEIAGQIGAPKRGVVFASPNGSSIEVTPQAGSIVATTAPLGGGLQVKSAGSVGAYGQYGSVVT
jgi:hypothetical protein